MRGPQKYVKTRELSWKRYRLSRRAIARLADDPKVEAAMLKRKGHDADLKLLRKIAAGNIRVKSLTAKERSDLERLSRDIVIAAVRVGLLALNPPSQPTDPVVEMEIAEDEGLAAQGYQWRAGGFELLGFRLDISGRVRGTDSDEQGEEEFVAGENVGREWLDRPLHELPDVTAQRLANVVGGLEVRGVLSVGDSAVFHAERVKRESQGEVDAEDVPNSDPVKERRRQKAEARRADAWVSRILVFQKAIQRVLREG